MDPIIATQPKRPVKGRFAPSPTGRMHAGNIYASLLTWLMVKLQQGSIVLRIEDLDKDRSRVEYCDLVMRDFEAFGLTWDEGPYFQSNRDDAYESAFNALEESGLVFPCFCSRADLKAASAPHAQDKWVYSGACSNLTREQQAEKRLEIEAAGRPGPSYRLRTTAATTPVTIQDMLQGPFSQDLASECGDFIIRRADGGFAYQLAVVIDDAAQGINFVSRGIDLLSSSPQQAYLQKLIGLPPVDYAHFPLLTAPDGRRLAKRDKDASMEQLMDEYKTPEGIMGHIAFVAGLIDQEYPCTPDKLLKHTNLEQLKTLYNGVKQIPYN